MNITLQKSDKIGAIASSLCVIHCLMTPLLFAAQSLAIEHHHSSPVWWENMDFLFVLISLLAVNQSTKNSNNTIIKKALWASWFILFFLILNEKVEWYHSPEIITYFVAFTLASLHIYNLNYCQCRSEDCCNKETK
jgi:hypothetical protein|tara:strand:+ start:3963 stop:4370 length:408 start_codon:yes stop_codon:yes gene_type:complete